MGLGIFCGVFLIFWGFVVLVFCFYCFKEFGEVWLSFGLFVGFVVGDVKLLEEE